MKKSVGVIITFLFLLLLVGCNYSMKLGETNYTYDDFDSYKEYKSETAISEAINNIKVDWIEGEIAVESGESISIKETNVKGTYSPLYYLVEDNTLTIKYIKSGVYKNDELPEKKLNLIIPDNLESLDIDSVSADYDIKTNIINKMDVCAVSGVGNIKLKTLNDFDLDSTSGSITIEAEAMKDINVDTVSGDTEVITNTLNKIDLDSTSGSLNIKISNSTNLTDIDVNTVSGDAIINVDGIKGYNLDFNSVSGKKNLGFTDGTDSSLAKFDVSFNSTSGDLTINKI